jgi:hypothetical protein
MIGLTNLQFLNGIYGPSILTYFSAATETGLLEVDMACRSISPSRLTSLPLSSNMDNIIKTWTEIATTEPDIHYNKKNRFGGGGGGGGWGRRGWVWKETKRKNKAEERGEGGGEESLILLALTRE